MKDQEKKEGKVLFPEIQEVIDQKKKKEEEKVMEITQYVQAKRNQAEEKFKASLPYYEEFFFTPGVLIKILLIKIMEAWYKNEEIASNFWARLKTVEITACLHRDFREDNERALWTGSIGSKKEISIHLYDDGPDEENPRLVIRDFWSNTKKETCLKNLTEGFQDLLWPKLKDYKEKYALAIELNKEIDFFDLLEKFFIEFKVKKRIFEKAEKEEEIRSLAEDKKRTKKQEAEMASLCRKIYEESKLVIEPKLDEVYNFLKSNTNYPLKKPSSLFLYGFSDKTIWKIIHDSELYNDEMDTVIGRFCIPLSTLFSFWRPETLITIVLSMFCYGEPEISFRLHNNIIGSGKEVLSIKDMVDKYVKRVTDISKENLDKIINNWIEWFTDNLTIEDLKDFPKEDSLIESSKFRKEFLESKKETK